MTEPTPTPACICIVVKNSLHSDIGPVDPTTKFLSCRAQLKETRG